MRRGVVIGAVVTGAIVGGAAAVAGAAGARWDRATARTTRRLMSHLPRRGAAARRMRPFSLDELVGLPEPVMRFFTFALTPGEPLVRHARVRWEGEFRLRPDASWNGFTATQHFTVSPPGFVWDAIIRMAPLVSVRVRDSYIAGEGAMLGKVAALVPVVEQHGTAGMAAGALSRYLGEAVWLPTALLPSAGVLWNPVDDETARATLRDGETTVTADFRFAANGAITGVSMTRVRDVDGRPVPTAFEGRYDGRHRAVFGIRVPVGGEVAWLLPEGRFAYWRGRAVQIEYDLARN